MAKKNPYLNDRDILDQALEHSWGKTADAKAKEKAYNREYYQRHKEEILRKARQAGEGIQRTAQNAYNQARTQYNAARGAGNLPSQKIKRAGEDVKTAFSKRGAYGRDWSMDANTIQPYERAHRMNERLYNEAKNRTAQSEVNERKASARYDRLNNAMNKNYAKAESEFNRSRELADNPNTKGLAKDAKGDAVNYQSRAREFQELGINAARQHLDSLRELHRAKSNQSRMAKRRAASGAAYNEASKAVERNLRGGADERFDSKLARDVQNAYSKLRNPKEMARRAGESAKNAVNSAKEYIDNARGKNGRRGAGAAQEVADKLSKQAKEQRTRADRFKNSAKAAVRANNSAYEQYKELKANPNTAGYAPQAAERAMNEANRAISYANQMQKNARKSSASAAAANAASNAANRPGYDTRYDSKIVRGAQNAYSKARKTSKQARDSVDQFVNNALSKAKKKKKS